MAFSSASVPVLNVSHLKKIKNIVIGNVSAKRELARDEVLVQALVQCLNHPPPLTGESSGSLNDICLEAAHIIASVAYGTEEALSSLLRADALRAILYALSRLGTSGPHAPKAALSRALRTLSSALADIVGPAQWGLCPDISAIRSDATIALDTLFQIESLDVFLPFLLDPASCISVAQLLGSAARQPAHCAAVTEWSPPADRAKDAKSKRGWEKTAATLATSSNRQGGWVARTLVGMSQSQHPKVQEATMYALASLVKDNAVLAVVLTRKYSDGACLLSTVLLLTTSRFTDVQLAACLCATNILRANYHHFPTYDRPTDTGERIMTILNRILIPPKCTREHRIKACFILYHLVIDNQELARDAYLRGCLEKLSEVVHGITPAEVTPEIVEEEPEVVSQLREAALTCIAAISLSDDVIRRCVTDELKLLPLIKSSLSYNHVGVRHAACQCIRVLSRAVAVLRTNIVDTGLGLLIFEICRKEDEDRRVTSAALAAVCNLVNDCSPLRPAFIEQGLISRLVQLLSCPDLRLNALWAVKNLVNKTSLETRQDVMNQIGWPKLTELMEDPDGEVREQAYSVLRNLFVDEQGMDMIFDGMGESTLFSHLTNTLSSSKNDDVILQAAYVLANLANGNEEHKDAIVSHPELIAALRVCLAENKTDIRKPAIACVMELIRHHPTHRRKVLVDAGLATTLRHISGWHTGGIVSMSPGSRHSLHSVAMEDSKEILENARVALDWLEHGSGDYTMGS